MVVELENNEIARIRVEITSPRINTDIRQDITLEWKAHFNTPTKPASISAADFYKRSSANQKLFEKAQAATDKKKYEEAFALLGQLVNDDPGDFQAWTELGTLNLIRQNLPEAEKAYLRAIEVRPKFFLAMVNLGKLRVAQKKYEEALIPLTLALELQPTSASLNFLLGETYLQVKKGSKAVVYLYEAIKLDPTGMTEAHLRLASLYHGAGLKDKAATEFEEFLKKKPEYPDRKKLEQYITQNRKR
jgi:tetratricopeptide (TPR) repeat protein